MSGLEDIEVADASSGETGPKDRALVILKKMLTNRILLIIAVISFCSGFLRNSLLKWARTFADGVNLKGSYIFSHWGMMSCVAITAGGSSRGSSSDHLFKSRRPPVSTLLFSVVLIGAVTIIPMLWFLPPGVSWVIVLMMMATIGVHGIFWASQARTLGGVAMPGPRPA